jgi:biopolymer transport protein ExbB
MGDGISYFDILVRGGGNIGYILWALSVLTVAMIVRLLIRIRRARLVPEPLRRQLVTLVPSRQMHKAAEIASQNPSLLGGIMHAALREHAMGYAAMERAMEETAEQRSVAMLRQIEWLNVLGNIGPMLGLLGTVWGMILAFFKIVEEGGIPNPGKLAGAIGIALVTTLLGLAVAIPALAAYAVLRHRVDELTNQALLIGQELIGRAMGGESDPTPALRPPREAVQVGQGPDPASRT